MLDQLATVYKQWAATNQVTMGLKVYFVYDSIYPWSCSHLKIVTNMESFLK